MHKSTLLLISVFLPAVAFGQSDPPPSLPGVPSQSGDTQSDSQSKEKGPPIKYNYLNVCSPNEAEQKEIAAALASVPKQSNFSPDFEVTRGRTSMQDAVPARYVRLRRELGGDSIFSNVQYSISTDAENTVETLVLKLKDPKELFSISLEDQVSAAATTPSSVLDVNTPVSRVKLERFGKSNIVLARCEGADQSVYEPLFQRASALFSGYRKSLGLRGMFKSDLLWLAQTSSQAPKKKIEGVPVPQARQERKTSPKTADTPK